MGWLRRTFWADGAALVTIYAAAKVVKYALIFGVPLATIYLWSHLEWKP